MRKSKFDRIFDTVVILLLALFLISVAYPLYFVCIASVSNPSAVMNGQVSLLPVGFSLEGYKRVIEYEEIWVGYRNTICYVIAFTLLSVSLTLMAGYAMSRTGMPGQRGMLLFMVFTMYFGGGMVPSYLLVSGLGLSRQPITVILLGSVSVYNIIITRTFMKTTIPESLFEAAGLDGCSHAQFFFRVVLPLSPAIIAVLALFNAVAQWNSWFNAMIYLREASQMPLQYKLRQLLLNSSKAFNDTSNNISMMGQDDTAQQMMIESMKYAVIIVSTLPILCLYPFVQKYFIKGIMIGAIKG